MALADVLAVSQAARSLVLLGDPRQLEQPTQGSHPDGVGVSALDHILGPHATVSADYGLFLEETWRLHPHICRFNSELFYDNRLKSRPGLERQEIKSRGRVRGSGLRYLPVEHLGNQSSSAEEADAIRELVTEILETGTTWIDGKGVEHSIELDDILIIAPYNAQVFELQTRIPGAHIGTVDKFQEQEAPIVLYSMATCDGRGQIKDPVSIRQRPAAVEDRAVPGHWEGDLLSGSKNSYIATLVERHTRYVMLAKVANKDTQTVISALIKQAKRLPGELYKSLTWDRGKELADHRRFTLTTNIDVYFCDPQSPWQRGSNENTNGLLRQYFPKGTDLSVHSQAYLNKVARQLNERPRETLQFETPAERFNACVASTG